MSIKLNQLTNIVDKIMAKVKDKTDAIEKDIKEVSSQIDEIEKQEVRTETLNNAVETYVNTAIDDGRMANLTIADDSIEGSKIKDGQITKNKLSSDMLSCEPDNYFEANLKSQNNMTWLTITYDLGENPSSECNVKVEEIISSTSNEFNGNCSIWFSFSSNYNNYQKSIYNTAKLNEVVTRNIILNNTNKDRYLRGLFMVGNAESKQVIIDKIKLYVNGELIPIYSYDKNVVTKYEKYCPYRFLNSMLLNDILKSDSITKENIDNKVGYKEFDKIDNAIWFKGAPDSWSGNYYRFLNYKINKIDFELNEGDKVTLKLKVYSKNIEDIIRFNVWHNRGGAPDYLSNLTIINKYTKALECLITLKSVQEDYYAMIFAPCVKTAVKDSIECYLYDISITKEDGSSFELIPTNAESSTLKYNQTFNILGIRTEEISITSRDLEESYLLSIKGKTIICAGDSLTVGYNGASNSYVDYIRNFYDKCTVLNKGSNGGGANRLVNLLTDMARDGDGTTYPIGNIDYTNVIAVIINIGTNGGITGNLETSIPQFTQKTIEDIPFDYEDTTIDTTEKYWALFKNDWWGNLSLIIEYIKWKNPKTQIFLTPPLPNKISDTSGNSPYKIRDAMLQLGELYGVHVIDTINGLGINKRNCHLFCVDYCHGTNLRNEIVGKYIAKQIYPHIYDF